MNNQTTEKPFYKSKKFWYAVAIAIAGIAKEAGIEIPAEALYAGLALILGQGLADLGKNAPKPIPETPPQAPEEAPTVPQQPSQTITQPEKAPEKAVIPELPEPFNAAEFDKAVISRAKEIYGQVTYSTRLFSARELGMVTRASHIQQALDYWHYLNAYAEQAFTEIWGYSYTEAQKRVSEPGCPNAEGGCGGETSLRNKAASLGPGFYTSFLDLERTKTTLLELEAVKVKGIDWKAKLYPQQQTLYWLGELAKYL